MNHNWVSKAKVIFLGDVNTGKSSLIYRFVNDAQPQNQTSSISLDICKKVVKVPYSTDADNPCRSSDFLPVKLSLWDLPGQERYGNSISISYFRNVDIVFLIFDSTNQESFESLKLTWINLLNRTCDSKCLVRVLVSTKHDSPSSVATEPSQVEDFINANSTSSNRMLFFETSSVSGENVEEAFYQAVGRFVDLTIGRQNESIKRSIGFGKYANICGDNQYHRPHSSQPSAKQQEHKIINCSHQTPLIHTDSPVDMSHRSKSCCRM